MKNCGIYRNMIKNASILMFDKTLARLGATLNDVI